MVLVLSAAVAASLWVLLWGLGAKGLDAMLLSLLVMILAAVAHVILPFLPGNRSRRSEDSDPAPFT